MSGLTLINDRIKNRCLDQSRNLLKLAKFRCKHFSFLIDKNKIVCFGINLQYKTHPLAKKYGHRFSSIHSEVHCLSRYKGDTGGLVLLNIRLDNWGNLKDSKPCEYCEKFLHDRNIQFIYSTDFGFEEC